MKHDWRQIVSEEIQIQGCRCRTDTDFKGYSPNIVYGVRISVFIQVGFP